MLEEYSLLLAPATYTEIEIFTKKGEHFFIRALYEGESQYVKVNDLESITCPVFLTHENIEGMYEIGGLAGWYNQKKP